MTSFANRIFQSTIILLCACWFLTACASLNPFGNSGRADRRAVEAAIEQVRPALVRIHVVGNMYYEGRAHKGESAGSGVIISPDGLVVTNHHVAGDAVRLICTLSNREEVTAELVGTDALSDIAVLRLKPAEPSTFAFARFGDSDSLQVGDKVLAMGCPLSLSQSITEGIIANTEMIRPSLAWRWQFQLDGEPVGSIVRWIGHDAMIFGGNSGGPLVNLRGEIVGINEIKMGLGGAIPANLVQEVVPQLIENGRIDRAYLGILVQPILKQDPDQRGALISDVIKGSPAEQIGVESGDRLLTVAGEPIQVRFYEQIPPLNLRLASLPIEEPVAVTVERAGDLLEYTLTPIVRERVIRDQHEFKQWGATGRDLSIWTALELKRSDKNGVLVTSVRPGGPCGQAKPAIEGGDILLEVAGEPVRNVDDLTSLTARLTEGQTDPVPTLVTFARQGQELMSVVEVGIQELNDPGAEVRKAWVPAAIQVITRELARQMDRDDLVGVRVTQVYEDDDTTGSMGLKVGDLIVALDGEPIPASETHHLEVFEAMVRQYRIGSEAELTILRDGEEMNVNVKLPGRPPQPREMKRFEDHDFEFTVRDVAYLDRKMRQWEDAPPGVMVEQVKDGGWAALGRMSVGDLLVAIDGEPVRAVAEVRAAMERIASERPDSVVFQVHRGIHTTFLGVEPLWVKNQ